MTHEINDNDRLYTIEEARESLGMNEGQWKAYRTLYHVPIQRWGQCERLTGSTLSLIRSALPSQIDDVCRWVAKRERR